LAFREAREGEQLVAGLFRGGIRFGVGSLAHLRAGGRHGVVDAIDA
jgi:hypothetical protein